MAYKLPTGQWQNITFARSDAVTISCSWSFEKSKARKITEMLTRSIWLEILKAYSFLELAEGLDVSKTMGSIRVGYVMIAQINVDRNWTIMVRRDP